MDEQRSNPLENPLIRYAFGLSGAVIIAFVAVFYLEGIARWVALGVAVLDAAVTPKILERVAENAESDRHRSATARE